VKASSSWQSFESLEASYKHGISVYLAKEQLKEIILAQKGLNVSITKSSSFKTRMPHNCAKCTIYLPGLSYAVADDNGTNIFYHATKKCCSAKSPKLACREFFDDNVKIYDQISLTKYSKLASEVLPSAPETMFSNEVETTLNSRKGLVNDNFKKCGLNSVLQALASFD
jgi:hypothetical protein